MHNEDVYLLDLFLELEGVEKSGISLKLNGYPSSPMQIAKACLIQEESCYMRDYQSDDQGNIHELCFDEVRYY